MRDSRIVLGLAALCLLALAGSVSALDGAQKPWIIVDRSWSDGVYNVSAEGLHGYLADVQWPKGVRMVRVHDLDALNRKGPFSPVVVQSWLGGRIDVYARNMTTVEVFRTLGGEVMEYRENDRYYNSGYRSKHRR